MSDLVANGADADKLAAILGLSSTDALYADPIATDNLNLAKAIQLVYAAKLVDPTQAALSAKVNAYTVSTATTTNTNTGSLPSFGENTKTTEKAPVETTTKTEEINSSLPKFGLTPVTTTANATAPTINIDALATMVVAAANNDPKVVAFVDAVKNATGSAADLETTVQTQKDAMVETLAPVNFNADVTTEATTTEANATVTADANTTDINTTVTTTGSNTLPVFGSSNTSSATNTTTASATETNTTTASATETNTTVADTTTDNTNNKLLPTW